MESNEEYLLRALRRTSNGLTDSLIPAHGAKLTKLVAKFDAAESVSTEVQTLMQVQGFGKCALAMEWLLERTRRSNDFFSPEQFESDVLLLNEKLFEAFLNQPFDMPDFSHSFEAPARPIQHIQISDDEFIGSSYPSASEPSSAAETHEEPAQPFAEPSWDTTSALFTGASAEPSAPADIPEAEGMTSSAISDPFLSSDAPFSAGADPLEFALREAAAEEPAAGQSSPGDSPSLRDSMTPDLFEATERVAQTAVEFIEKQPGDRTVAMAVFRVTVRAAMESAKDSSNVVAQDVFGALLKLISYTDEQGKIKSEPFAHAIRDVGDRLQIALREPSGGIALMRNLTTFLADPKELLSH
ncbi:MAG: hypothetical protein HUU02_12520 [Bacteroidetes bacterium]|nr:hypothetical protein [Bacteroidota bacterium]